MTTLLVAAGAGLGAAIRYAVGHLLDDDHPVGTFLVNVVGSFLLGLIVGLSPGERAAALLGAGFCGGLTTYSSFAVQTWALRERGPVHGVVYAVASIGLGLGACALGYSLVR